MIRLLHSSCSDELRSRELHDYGIVGASVSRLVALDQPHNQQMTGYDESSDRKCIAGNGEAATHRWMDSLVNRVTSV